MFGRGGGGGGGHILCLGVGGGPYVVYGQSQFVYGEPYM